MTKQEQIKFIREKCIEANPDIKKLEFGCHIDNVLWYKTEKDKEEGTVDWKETGMDSKQGVIVKDLRSEFLPMWVDYGEQLEFQIQHDDIVSFEIIGRDIRLADVLLVADNAGKGKLDAVRNNILSVYDKWNLLKDNLNDQSDETIEFIYNLLK